MIGLRALSRSRALMHLMSRPTSPGLRRTLFGVEFPNPVGLAAGFDKNAVALPAWEALGFGFVEIGTVTAEAQPGNSRPRIFRVRDKGALINRMGFNNDGADAVAERLEYWKRSDRWPGIPVGINIGKSKVTPLEEASDDYRYTFRRLAGFADYVVLNVSSPNTPGLRTLQKRDALDSLLGAVQSENLLRAKAVPMLLKIAPDLEESRIEEIIELVERHELAGMIATNTTLDHSAIPEAERTEGGLSGDPLRDRSTEIIRFIASRTSLPIIGVGGISSPEGALEKLDAGASLVQLYTGFVYHGPGLIREICKALPPA